MSARPGPPSASYLAALGVPSAWQPSSCGIRNQYWPEAASLRSKRSAMSAFCAPKRHRLEVVRSCFMRNSESIDKWKIPAFSIYVIVEVDNTDTSAVPMSFPLEAGARTDASAARGEQDAGSPCSAASRDDTLGRRRSVRPSRRGGCQQDRERCGSAPHPGNVHDSVRGAPGRKAIAGARSARPGHPARRPRRTAAGLFPHRSALPTRN